MSLIDKLVEKGILDKKKSAYIKEEAKKSGKPEETFILEENLVPESILFRMKAEDLKIPLGEIDTEDVPLKTLESIPEETAKYYQMIPFRKTETALEIGMVRPEDLKAQEALKFLARQKNFKYKVFLITPTTFQNLLSQYRTLKKEVGRALEELETELKEEGDRKKTRTADEYERIAEEAPISKIVAVILRSAVEGNASDIHIEPTREELRIRFRLLGDLHSSIVLPLKTHPAVVARIKILSNLKIDETRMPQDGRFSTKIDDKTIDYRVSTFPTTLGEKVAIRVLDPQIGKHGFEELGIERRNLKLLKENVKKPFGLILVTGPTGSGKTTTLYAILHLLNKEEVNIITLEDPVEYFFEGVNQSQVRPDIGYTFASGLRHILRQDPDIIMVGEIRDEETASLVIHAALTGHIVLSTLHTSSTLGVVPRMVDMGVKPYLIPPTLQLAIAQRLVRRLCEHCRKKVVPKPKIKEIILKELDEIPEESKREFTIPKPLMVYEAKGCPKCSDTGFSGRVAIYEVLAMTDSLADIVLKEPSESKVLEEAKKQGMTTMRQDGLIKVLNGATTIEEIFRVTEVRT
ncbi:MAG: GspE/PulE family protein [Candidatus Nealsonbacteria bacterium]